MLVALCRGSQMAVLMSEQPGSDSFVDGNSDSAGTQTSLGCGIVLIAERASFVKQKFP